MARFAEVINNEVVNVIAVNDAECIDEYGKVSQVKGQQFLRSCNLNSLFILTDTAAIGDTYDAVNDVFVAPVSEVVE